MIKITIVIPVYNVELYIQRCLESVISQENIDYSIECVIIDDCTPDNSMIIVYDIINNYKGTIIFSIVRHEQNKGLSEARNTGMKHAHGEFIMFLDSDDYLMPDSIAYMFNTSKDYPSADIIMGNVYEHKYSKTQYDYKEPILISGGYEVRKWLLTHEFAVSSWNRIFNRQFLINNKFFFEPNILHEDIPWSYKVYTKIQNVLLLPKVTYSYWYNQNSITSTQHVTDKTVRSYVRGCQIMLEVPYEPNLFVYQHLYIFRSLLNASNARTNCSSPEIITLFKSVRSQLMSRTVKNKRIILALFFTLLYHPVNILFKIRLFRRYYNQMSKAIARIANTFNFLHKRQVITDM